MNELKLRAESLWRMSLMLKRKVAAAVDEGLVEGSQQSRLNRRIDELCDLIEHLAREIPHA